MVTVNARAQAVDQSSNLIRLRKQTVKLALRQVLCI
jgi:hypothetical protein